MKPLSLQWGLSSVMTQLCRQFLTPNETPLRYNNINHLYFYFFIFSLQDYIAIGFYSLLRDRVLATGLIAGLISIALVAIFSLAVLALCQNYRKQHYGEWMVNGSHNYNHEVINHFQVPEFGVRNVFSFRLILSFSRTEDLCMTTALSVVWSKDA